MYVLIEVFDLETSIRLHHIHFVLTGQNLHGSLRAHSFLNIIINLEMKQSSLLRYNDASYEN